MWPMIIGGLMSQGGGGQGGGQGGGGGLGGLTAMKDQQAAKWASLGSLVGGLWGQHNAKNPFAEANPYLQQIQTTQIQTQTLQAITTTIILLQIQTRQTQTQAILQTKTTAILRLMLSLGQIVSYLLV